MASAPASAALLVFLVLGGVRAQATGGDAKADSGAARVPEAAPAAKESAAAKDSAGIAAFDSARAVDTLAQTKLYEYIAHPILQLLTMPVEFLLVPAVRGVIFPIKAPLRYFLNENVIDRTIDLISFGQQDRIMLYPTLNLAPGTGSYTGLTMRHTALFGRPSERGVIQGVIYVNGDWKMRGYMTAAELAGTDFDIKFNAALNRVKNTSVNQPGTNLFWFYADTSVSLTATLSRPVVEKLAARVGYTFRNNNFGQAPPQEDQIESSFFINDSGQVDLPMRGLESKWQDHMLNLGLVRDTRNNENITLAGSDMRLGWTYHFAQLQHDHHTWQAVWTKYFKLGSERYEITAEEERKAGGMSLGRLLEQVEYEKLREQLFNRKVVAMHVYAAQSFEVPGNHMPVYGLQTLGNDTPMRGYGGSRFRDYTVLSIGGEYRFPVMRLVDGVIFNEYGVFGRSWEGIDYLGSLKNSWGFGIRVRRPDIFLFRLQLGFHGYHGIQLNMSVDAPY